MKEKGERKKMNKNMYELAEDIIFIAQNNEWKTMPKGTLVSVRKMQGTANLLLATTIDGKAKAEVKLKSLKKCPLTLNEGEILVVEFSQYHQYHSFGYDVKETIDKMVATFNTYAASKYTLKRIAKEMSDSSMCIYKVPIDGLCIDDEYHQLCESYSANFVGDFLSLYRKPFNTENDYFAKGKKYK